MAARLTVVSNGHGEDAIGAAVVRAVRACRTDVRPAAYPLVGTGAAYAELGIPVLGPRRSLPSGGLTLHARENAVADLKAGWASLTLTHAWDLARTRTDVLLVVGDLFAQLLCAPLRSRARFVYQAIVSRLQADGSPPPWHRTAMERFTYPERLLMRHRAHRVYARDAGSAAWLRAHGVPHAVALGNPAVDAASTEGAAGGADAPVGEGARSSLALLPGSRAHAPRALAVMLDAVAELGHAATVAWAHPEPPRAADWSWLPADAAPGPRGTLARDGARVAVLAGDVRAALRHARVALATAGTAAEQAAALGVPVIAFPVPPEHTAAFLAGQKRLLGAALTVVEPNAPAVAAAARALWRDTPLRAAAEADGRARMGGAGGTAAIARDLIAEAVRLGALPA